MDAGPFSSRRTRTGWIAFAGVYLLVAGTMNAIWGLAALTDRHVLLEGELAWANLTTWGWVSAAVAVLQLAAGASCSPTTRGPRPRCGDRARRALRTSSRSVPTSVWSILALVANGLVLWAVTVYGDAFD